MHKKILSMYKIDINEIGFSAYLIIFLEIYHKNKRIICTNGKIII